MFTLGSVKPVVLEPLPVPKLCLTGRSPVRGTTIDLSHIEVVPNMNLWPLFHNGVAAGLRVCPTAPGIDSTWIAYNKQKVGSVTWLIIISSLNVSNVVCRVVQTARQNMLGSWWLWDWMVISPHLTTSRSTSTCRSAMRWPVWGYYWALLLAREVSQSACMCLVHSLITCSIS